MNKILFLAKTNLNNDGRILNQIKILQNHYHEGLRIDFILLPDKPLKINIGTNVAVHCIQTSFRNLPLLRILTVFEFTWKVIWKLFKLKPKIVHVEDSAVVLPIYFYRLFKGRSFKLIYDDHEMPNENESQQYRIIQHFETKIMKQADVVIFANQERMEFLKEKYNLQNKLTYFLNLPYFKDSDTNVVDEYYESILAKLHSLRTDGFKFIIHQGSLEVERGRGKLAAFSRILQTDVKILIIGVSKKDFDDFITDFQLNRDNFYFVGSVPYSILNRFWEMGDAAIIMYLPTYINNRLCAPNRFYIAINNQIPVLVNKDNPVLNNFIEKYKAGFFIENMQNDDDLNRLFKHTYKVSLMKDLIRQESTKLIETYENI